MAGKTFEVTEATFETDILNSEQPVLVDFWAEWCGPCHMIAPIVDDISNQYDGKLRVAKIDADTNMNVMQQYGIMGIPTLLLFKQGELVERMVGYQDKERLLSKIEPHLG